MLYLVRLVLFVAFACISILVSRLCYNYNYYMTFTPLKFDDEKEEEELHDIREAEEEDVIKRLSDRYGLPYINLMPISIENDALRLVPEKEARAAKIAPFGVTGKKLSLALFSPNMPETQTMLAALKEQGFILTLYMASTKSLEKAWYHYKEISSGLASKKGTVDIEPEELAAARDRIHSLPDAAALIKETIEKKAGRASEVFEIILAGAFGAGASDIHLEPEEAYIRLRYRLDGVLQEVMTFAPEVYRLILSRVKLLSGLKLNVRDMAQDGRFSVEFAETQIEIRTSILPGSYGESIVLRILDPKSISVPLEDLGIHPTLLEVLMREISKPNGMLLTTGPTGSGKTTTLYAFLRKIHTPDIKIITIEDPIEYHLAGIVQTQVETEKHYTFAAGLRASLRQDPDIIMVGEIRDEETAEIAINASLTGHLVFSTLHTNNAAGTYPRLIDLGVNPKVISSAISVSMAQRLIRKLCQFCKQEKPIEGVEKERIDRITESIVNKALIPAERKMWIPKGCEKCNKTGFKGRSGVYEAIIADHAIEDAINKNPSEREIIAAAKPQGILNMRQDGIIKVLTGVTSMDELQRVIDLDAE